MRRRMDETERQKEIAKIERELHLLQSRYANLDRAGKRMLIMTYVLALGFYVAFVAASFSDNPTVAILTAVLTPVLAVAVWFLWPRLKPSFRWIDAASQAWTGSVAVHPYVDEAQAVEIMVAERVERLARLRGNEK